MFFSLDPAYGSTYESTIGPNDQPAGCVCKPSFCVQPCFANLYISELDGCRGYCGCNHSYSYDPETLQGGCCDNGLSYSSDPISGVGGRCSGTAVASFVGTCRAPTPPAPLTPCTSPFPGGVAFGGKTLSIILALVRSFKSFLLISGNKFELRQSNLQNKPRWRERRQ